MSKINVDSKQAREFSYGICWIPTLDLGGLDQSPVMSDWQKLKEVSRLYNNADDTPQHQANLRWARRLHFNNTSIFSCS